MAPTNCPSDGWIYCSLGISTITPDFISQFTEPLRWEFRKIISIKTIGKLQKSQVNVWDNITKAFLTIPEFGPWISVLFSTPFSLSDLICFPGFIYKLYTSDTQICVSSLRLSPELWASLVAQMVKNLPAVWETWIRSLEEEMATHSSILAWRIPMDRGAWWAMGYIPWGVKKSDTTKQLSTARILVLFLIFLDISVSVYSTDMVNRTYLPSLLFLWNLASINNWWYHQPHSHLN